MSNTQKTKIKVQDVLDMLSKGFARRKGEKLYNPEIGSVQEHYNLEAWEVTELFKHPKLAGKRTIIPKVFSFIIEDEGDEQSEVIDVAEQAAEATAQKVAEETDLDQEMVNAAKEPWEDQ